MRELKTQKPNYGNWVPMRLLVGSSIPGVFLLGLSFVFIPFLLGSAVFIVLFVYLAYAYYKFSPQGGNLQARIRELVLNSLNWDGEGCVIDIGSGNAPLTIMTAKKFPNAHVTGVDYWGGRWAYSKSVCERNAKIEGVADRVSFQKASASVLPFEDETFDAAVSNLVFHEVRDTRNKRDVIKEALRVINKGGRFAFQDLFLDKRVYGEVDDLLEVIRSWGVESVEFIDTSKTAFIPDVLKFRFMVGTIGILYGKK